MAKQKEAETAMTDELKRRQTSEEKPKKERKPRKVKPTFGADHGVQEDGKFTVVPNPGEESFTTFARLKKKDFATEATYFRYQAALVQERANTLLQEVQELQELATLEEKFGNSDAKKKARLLAKRRKEMANLENELKELGVDIDAI
jgi:hypothetical protein